MISNVRADRFNRSYIASLDADLAHYSQPAHFNPLRGKLNRRLGRFGPRQFIWEGSDTERYVGFSGEAAMAQGLGAGGRGDTARLEDHGGARRGTNGGARERRPKARRRRRISHPDGG